jgi:hypothetical protein
MIVAAEYLIGMAFQLLLQVLSPVIMLEKVAEEYIIILAFQLLLQALSLVILLMIVAAEYLIGIMAL